MIDTEYGDDLAQDIAGDASRLRELSYLFGDDVVEQARLIDIADLNMTDEMTTGIGEGIRQLKELKYDPGAQKQWIEKLEPGLRLLLCLWIMDMDLLGKIQAGSGQKENNC